MFGVLMTQTSKISEVRRFPMAEKKLATKFGSGRRQQPYFVDGHYLGSARVMGGFRPHNS